MLALTLTRLTAICCTIALGTAAAVAAPPDFERDVASLLVRRCLECHNAHDANGGLVLANADGLKRGGDGGPVLTLDKLHASPLIERVLAGEMPPPRQGKPVVLPPEEIAVLKGWVAAGAPWPSGRTLDLYERTTDVRGGRDWWSLQPVRRPAVPATPGSQNPIDSFIARSLQQAGLEPAPPADRATLIRRAYEDLWGLPAPAEEIEAFIADPRPEAWELLIDRLLASPHFGERWARYWLDLVRYADTSGYERDQEKPGAWRYRDWVVRSFNDDLLYNRFVIEQLAGDELPDRTEDSVVATGFLRLGTWNDEPNDPEEYKYDRLEDLVHATTTAFQGLTVKCARCHDHKFDPIPQVDYYRIGAAFWAGPIEARGGELLGGPSKEELGSDALGWTDLSKTPPPLRLLAKGDPLRPKDIVEAGVLSFAPELDRPLDPPPDGSRTTTRRLQLAEWIVDPRNPLTARLAVNRLWQHHFGAGLVRSPNNFGYTGDKPTHPELLDWLAAELVDHSWSLKHIHRLLLTSRVYQQASVHPRAAEFQLKDATNRLWWHAERRRLDAEALRDRLLVAGSGLDDRLYGPGFRPTVSSEGLEGLSRKAGAWQAAPEAEQHRRSLYLYSQRSLLSPFMTVFDLADSTQPCEQRDASNVAPQALALLNNDFVHAQSDALAERLLAHGDSSDSQIESAWRIVLGRRPSATELQAGLDHLESQRQRFVAQQTVKPADDPVEMALPAADALTLHLTASTGVELDDNGRVAKWLDQSSREHHAVQTDRNKRPVVAKLPGSERPTLQFDGEARFLNFNDELLPRTEFTFVAVANDRAKHTNHREILSNWVFGPDLGKTIFFGLTGTNTVRLSDDYIVGANGVQTSQTAVWMALADEHDAQVFHNDRLIGNKRGPLSPRKLGTPWVIGQQGNIQGEYWHGDIAEIYVFDRALSDAERLGLWRQLALRYGFTAAEPVRSPEFLALASLCHVLLNCNEFLHVD